MVHGVTWEFVSPILVINCLYNLKLIDILLAVQDDGYICSDTKFCLSWIISVKLKETLDLLII